MDINPEQEIRWEIIEEYLQHPDRAPRQGENLTEAEKEMLLVIKRTGARLRPSRPDSDYPVEPAWAALRQRIVDGARSPKRSAVLLLFRRLSYAAAAIVLLAGGAWLWRQRASPRSGQSIPTAAILTPRKGVQLILSGGRRLDANSRQTLKEQEGVTVSTANGNVTYQAGPAQPATIEIDTLEVPRGNKSKLTLSDGTTVWVDAASRLAYPRVFGAKTREVDIEGEAYFDVVKDPERPFIVHARGMSINVLGTGFNVNTYEPIWYTTLEKGKISVTADGKTLLLAPGEQARFGTTAGTLEKEKVDPYPYVAWKDGEIYMENASFAKIANRLAREYDYELNFADPALANLHFTVDMQAPEKLQEVLDHITSTTEGVRFEIQGREINISKTNSNQ